jgi:hypothetical protein
MKTLKALLALSVLSFAFIGPLAAADSKPAGSPAKCCAKSAEEGGACTHSCCAEAAKAGKHCEKCGGKNEKKES